ncbi:hypothetical protein NPIL_433651, partial [Nephila pilipes]
MEYQFTNRLRQGQPDLIR